METLDFFLTVAYVIVNVFSVVQLVGSFQWPTMTRVMFFVIFTVAAFVNARTALETPWVYQSYADYALPLYSRFILGSFEAIIQPLVLLIAAGQVAIALSMWTKRRWFRAGCVGGMVFCLAIVPLGLGSAFPATMILAIAFLRLYQHEHRSSIGDIMNRKRVKPLNKHKVHATH